MKTNRFSVDQASLYCYVISVEPGNVFQTPAWRVLDGEDSIAYTTRPEVAERIVAALDAMEGE